MGALDRLRSIDTTRSDRQAAEYRANRGTKSEASTSGPKTYGPTVAERENSIIGQMVTDSQMAYRQESKNDNSLARQAARDNYALDEYRTKRLTELRTQHQQATVGLDLDTAATLKDRITALEKSMGQHWTDRVGNTLIGSAKQYGGSMVAAAAISIDAVNARSARLSRDGYTISPEQSKAASDRLWAVANSLSDSGAKDIEQAKKGLTGVGSFAVDAAVGLTQLGADIGLGAVTGGGAMIPMAVRGFGGGAQEARNEGATLDQQVAYGALSALVEVATEKISSVGNAATKAFGKGAADDILEGAVAAVERMGKTPAGKMALNRLATAGVSFLSEGAEESISAIVNPILKNITYKDGEKISWSDVGYEALVGGVIGAITGGVGGTNVSEAQRGYNVKKSGDVEAILQVALNSDKNGDAYKAADKLRNRKGGAAQAPDAELGRLAMAVEELMVKDFISTKKAVDKAQNSRYDENVVTDSATVLNRGASLYLAEGLVQKPKKAEAKAKLIQDLIDGKKVDDETLKALNLTNAKFQAVFTELTGVTFEGTKTQEQVFARARTAHEVAEQRKATEAVVAQTQARAAEPTTDKERRLKKGYDQQRNIVSQESPERQAYLREKYEQHQTELEALAVGDRLVDDAGNIVGEVVDKSPWGITVAGDAFMERIPVGTFADDGVISFLETGEGRFERGETTAVAEVAEVAEARDPGNGPADFETFAGAYLERQNPNATEPELREAYNDYIAYTEDPRIATTASGAPITKSALRRLAKKVTGKDLGEEELNEFFEALYRDSESRGSQGKDSDGGMPLFDVGEEATSELSGDEKWAVLTYKSGGSYALNAKLTTEAELSDYEKLVVQHLDTALQKLPKYEGRVYRNLSFGDFDDAQENFDAFMAQASVGAEMELLAYTSTSAVADGHPIDDPFEVRMVLDVTNGRELTLGNNFESEILMGRGASIVITEVRYDENNTPTIYAREVAQDGKQEAADESKTPDGRRTSGDAKGNRAAESGGKPGPDVQIQTRKEGVNEDGVENEPGALERNDPRTAEAGRAAHPGNGERGPDRRGGAGRNRSRGAGVGLRSVAEEENQVSQEGATGAESRPAGAPFVMEDAADLPSYPTWSRAYFDMERDKSFNLEIAEPPGLSGEAEVGYMKKGKWVTLATYPATDKGLKQFHEDLPRLLNQSDPGLLSKSGGKKGYGKVEYDLYADDPESLGLGKAAKDAARVGVKLNVVKGKFMKSPDGSGRNINGFTSAKTREIFTTANEQTADHEVMHAYLAADHDFRNRLVAGMESKTRQEAFRRACEAADELWSHYAADVKSKYPDPVVQELYHRYYVECEVLCDARAGSEKLGPFMKKLIPYVQRETAKWEKEWDATEHGKITLKSDPNNDELIAFFGEDSDAGFDDGFDDPYGVERYLPSGELDSDGNELSVEQSKRFANSKIRNRAGELLKLYHGTDQYGFTVFDRRESGDKRSFFLSDSVEVAQSYSGTRAVRSTVNPNPDWGEMSTPELVEAFNQTSITHDMIRASKKNPELLVNMRTGKRTSREEIIEYLEAEYAAPVGNIPAYAYAENPLIVDANGATWSRIPVPEEIREAFMEKYHMDRASTHQLAEFAEANGYDGLMIYDCYDVGAYPAFHEEATIVVVFESNQIKDAYNLQPTDSPDFRYNLPEQADPLYSYMLKTVLAHKGDKLGASSVVSYLRGRGVKQEEIKWSGIETFLEGKRSVTKDELAQFLYENALVVDQEVLTQDATGDVLYANSETGELHASLEDAYSFAWDMAEERGWDPESVYTESIEPGLYALMGNDPSSGLDEVLFYLDEHPAADSGQPTRWHQYKTEGGENYREYLYKIPGAAYSNQAMKVHWEREGVLAHARVQDFETANGEKILFIDEIQSDWHNAGQKAGYTNIDYGALMAEQRRLVERGRNTWTEKDVARYDEIGTFLHPKQTEAKAKLNEWRDMLFTDEILSGILDKIAPGIMRRNNELGYETSWFDARRYASNTLLNYESVDEWLADKGLNVPLLTDEEDVRLDTFYEGLRHRKAELDNSFDADRELRSRPPEAPFSKNYHEFVLKTLLREAAEKGYEYLAWTTADMQSERWSDEYAEGYRIEYDQDIPKFLNKYGKQWGAKVGLMELNNNPDAEWNTTRLRNEERDLAEWRRELELASNDSQREFIRNQIAFSEKVIADLKKQGDTVWYIPITPAMRDSVLYEGQPMFDMPATPNREQFKEKFDAMYGAGSAEALFAAADEAFAQASKAPTPKAPASQGDESMVGWAIYKDARSIGSAALGFDPYSYLQNEFGTIEQTGKNNHRVAEVPKSTNGRNKVSKTASTVMGAKATPDARLGDIAQAVVDGDLSYYPTKNKIAENKARARIRKIGYKEALSEWTESVDRGRMNSDLVAMGATLLNNAGNSDMSGREYARVLAKYAQLLRSAGQALQAANIFKKMSPQAKLYNVVREVEEINSRRDTGLPVSMWMDEVGELLADEIYKRIDVKEPRARVKSVADTILDDLKKYAGELVARESVSGATPARTELERLQDMFRNKDKYEEAWQIAKNRLVDEFGAEANMYAALEAWVNSELTVADKLTKILTKQNEIVMNESLAEEYLAAETEEAREEIMDRILQNVADQIPATGMDKFTALRYTGMLGNLRTNVRNVAGNSLMVPIRMTKTVFSGLAQALIQKAGVDIDRTTSLKRDRETLKAAKVEFEKVKDIIAGGGKYQDNHTDISQEIRKRQRIFKNAYLEGLRKGSGWLMENEYFGDAAFSSFAFSDSLSRYIAANGTTWSQASEELKEKALEHAVREAAEATFRDNNALSEAVSKIRFRNPKNWAEKGLNLVAEGILPFRKTPANVLMRALEYSPIGLTGAMVNTVRKAANKSDVTATDLIDSVAKGLTGSAIVAIGMALADSGILKGSGPDDEKEKELWEMQGHQKYSLEIGGTSYTIDWASPISIPLLVGAELQEALLTEGLSIREATGVVSAIFDPLLEMSMLQGINDAISNAQTYGDESALVRFVGNALWSYVTQPIPTLLGQIERSGSNTRMTTYVDKNKDLPDAVQRALGKASAKIPVWDYAQVEFIDAWGRTQANADSATLNVIEQFLSPGYANTIVGTDMEDELLRLHQVTGDSAVLISSAPKYFNVDKQRKDLTADEYLVYAKTRGQTAFSIVSDLTSSSSYTGLTDKQKADAVKKVYDFSNQIAKEIVTDGKSVPEKWVTEAQRDVVEYGIPMSTYALAYAATKDTESIKDRKGETVDNSKSLRVLVTLYELPGLSDEQVRKLAEDFGVNESVRKYSAKMAQSKLAAMEKRYG